MAATEPPPPEASPWQRLDLWLWYARLQKTRSAASRLCESGALRLNRVRIEKAHARLRPGDVLTLPVGGTIRVVRVRLLAARRGPFAEARTLYEELAEPGEEQERGAEGLRSLSPEGM